MNITKIREKQFKLKKQLKHLEYELQYTLRDTKEFYKYSSKIAVVKEKLNKLEVKANQL